MSEEQRVELEQKMITVQEILADIYDLVLA